MAIRLPEALVQAIRSGDCVALVGAGFSAPAKIPPWKELLREVALRAGRARALPDILALIEQGSAHALDQAAQLLEDSIQREAFVRHVREIVAGAARDRVQARLDHLLGIPFRAILTTSFDHLLDAHPRGSGSTSRYELVLRPRRRDVFARAFRGRPLGTPVVKLHGDLAGGDEDAVVLTRRDYRRRLYDHASYTTFLRATLATTTVLYLGFSFGDAYLNELRSEVLSMLGGRSRTSRPLAYAIANDVPPALAEHFRRHERIQVLSFDSLDGSDFRAFDAYLAALYRETNPLPRFARALADSRILWLDRHAENNAQGESFLARCAALNREFRVDPAATPAEAVGALDAAARAGRPYDLVITHWGEHAGSDPVALQLLRGMRAARAGAPVVIFAAERDVASRRRRGMAEGAYGYFHRFEDLFEEVQRVLGARRSAS